MYAALLEFTGTAEYTIQMKKALFVCCIWIYLFLSCSNKNGKDMFGEYTRIRNAVNNEHSATHRWFYFTEEGFKESTVPRTAPKVQKKPWTQARRITSAALIDGTGYFTVNKLGILVCPSASGSQSEGIASQTKLIKNIPLFSQAAAGSLFCIEQTPVLNLYTNDFFNTYNAKTHTANGKENGQTPFLIQYVPENRNFIPLLSANDFDWQKKAELRELFFNGTYWYALLKETQDKRTDFYAYRFSTVEPVTAFASVRISAEVGTSGFKPHIISESIDVDALRTAAKPRSANEMSDSLQELLSPISENVPWYLDYICENAQTVRHFVRRENEGKARQAYANSSANCTVVVFEDGTVCFAGTLPMKHVVNEGKPVVFKLPRLPKSYSYGASFIAGSNLFTAWEETAFFETGKSGFLAVDLEQVLYRRNTEFNARGRF